MKTRPTMEPPPGAAQDLSVEDDSFKPWSLQRQPGSSGVGSVLAAAQEAQDQPAPQPGAEATRGHRAPRRKHGSIISIISIILLLVAVWVVGGASLLYGPFAREIAAILEQHPGGKPALWVAAVVIGAVFLTMALLIYRGSQREVVLMRAKLEERQKAEARLAASLREKDALLKEVHHRVKNNMQLITSLVGLQAGSIPEGPLHHVFQDFQGRVRTIALISERLYQSKNLAIIDMPGFVSSLGEDLLRSNGAAGRVNLAIQVEPVSLDVDTAVPCGLIMNELLTNSLQHGFPADRQGVLGISLHANGNNSLVLNVSDDGAGMPPGLDFETCDTLGLQLVRILTAQLDGSVRLDRSKGTSFTIDFPKPSLV